MRFRPLYGAIGLGLIVTSASLGQDATLKIDTSDLPRLLLKSDMTIEVPAFEAADGTVSLWYPKWVPGSHAPGGPIENLAGLWFEDENGNTLDWKREPGEVCKFNVSVPREMRTLHVRVRYITNQPNPNSRGLDSWGSESIGVVSANTVLLYPEWASCPDWYVTTSVVLPDDWVLSSALEQDVNADGAVELEPASVMRLVDTPMMVGRHRKIYDIHDGEGFAVHRLHVFSEIESAVEIGADVLENFEKMASESAALFGTAPFPSMDILLATSNVLPRNGLEHLRTTFNIIPLNTLDDPDDLTGWNRMLVPHEYCHAWCGKYRRPAGMATDDFHTPKDTDLLWVYEGLTQYLGELLEVRSGMMSEDEFRWIVNQRVRSEKLQQGRDWRSLYDTCAASHILRGGSASWSDLRRSQDYYSEGALIWLEADAIIRKGTKNAMSLDDFVKDFLGSAEPTDNPNPYLRGDVVTALDKVYKHDWDAFIAERVDRSGTRGPLSVAKEIGYTIEFTNEPPKGPKNAKADELDARDSIGVRVSSDGTVRTVLLGTPADEAGLAPGTKIIGIDGYTWSRQRFVDAIEASAVDGSIKLLTVSGDRLVDTSIIYEGGPRYMTLVRDNEAVDVLGDIVKSQAK